MPPSNPRREMDARIGALVREVRSSLVKQSFGAGTVADLQLPEGFLRRCTDRGLIARFNDQHRIVVGTPPQRPQPVEPPETLSPLVRLVPGVTTHDRRWATAPGQIAGVPRGYKFDIGSDVAEAMCPSDGDPYELRRAAALVAKRLASDGLVVTAVEAAAVLRPLLAEQREGVLGPLLKRAGMPTDLLGMVALEGGGGFGRGGFVDWLERRVAAKGRAAAIREELRAARLDFQPTLPTFLASDDAGGATALLIRLQLTRADDWFGQGDGGSLDVARQVARLFPATPLVLSAREDHAPLVAGHAAWWSAEFARTAEIVVLSESVTVSQWAQDNARGGTVARGGLRAPAALLPRYASRGDELSAMVPGDSALVESLGLAGIETGRSPLHMQGGNTIVVDDAARSRRVLLVGEAEVYRNVALGLTREQVLQALCIELGTDRAVVLPGVSYHIDYEVLCLSDVTTGEVTAFVPGTIEAERLIVRAGIDAMARAGILEGSAAERLRAGIDGSDSAAIAELFGVVGRDHATRGGFPVELAEHFAMGLAGESAVGNFMNFLDALDGLAAEADVAGRPGIAPVAAAALGARKRLNDDRAQIRAMVQELGWSMVEVPAHPAAHRSVNPLNAVATRNAVTVPFSGGILEDVGKRAVVRLNEASPGRDFRMVCTSESQHRNGSLRCAAMVFC